MLSKTNYREPAFKIFIPIAGTCALIGNGVILTSMITSNFDQSTITSMVYACVSSLCFANHTTFSSNAHLILKMKSHVKPKFMRSSMALGGLLWVICNAIAFANMLQGSHLNGALYLFTSAATLYIFLKLFAYTLHQLSYDDYEAEQVKIMQSRLQDVYKTYKSLTHPTAEDEAAMNKAMNPKGLTHVHNIKVNFEMKVISLRTSKKQ